jgi:protein SCO1/2
MNAIRVRPALIALALLAGYPILPAFGHGDHSAHSTALPSPGYVRTLATYPIPDAKLVDMDGADFALRAGLDTGRPVMVNFVFTSCAAICPVMSATFSQVQERLRGEEDPLQLVSISIDPEHDTPARLREYAKKFGAGPQWKFVTGSAEESIAVQRAFDVYRGDKMSHDPVTFIRAASGKSWIRLEGFAAASDLIREYRRLVPR